MKLKKTKTAGGVVLNKNGEVLVVNQNGNSWSLPKGHVEKGEKLIDTAKREIYEESGVKHLIFLKELGHYKRYRIGLNEADDCSEEKEIHLFLFKTKDMDLKPVDSNNPEARWLNPEEVCAYLTHEKDKQFFTKLLCSGLIQKGKY
jgi:ADP-ribose pyrophosphatase YjhB (NUDIX family)